MIRFVATLCVAFLLLCSAQAGSAAVYTVTKIADTNDGVCDVDCSLREAVAVSNATAVSPMSTSRRVSSGSAARCK